MAAAKRRNLSKQCDVLYGRLVRAPGVCVHCGSEQSIQCAHGFSRSYRAIRWDRRNGFALCRACHVFFTHRPLEWDEWLRVRWGPDLYDELRCKALTGAAPNLKLMLVGLQELAATA